MTVSIPYLTSDDLAEATGVTHAFFTRQGGVSDGIYTSLNMGYGSDDDSGLVFQNRARAAEVFNLEANDLVTLYQVHSPDCVVIEDNSWMLQGEAPKADAMATATPGVALAICTADCAPVLFADKNGGVVGAAHAGWKGAVGGVIEATIHAMESLGSKRSDIIGIVGPCIAQASYEVGPEFRDRFLEQSPANEMYFIPSGREKHFRFDLEGYAVSRLKSAGVAVAGTVSRDTCAEEDSFFSYRRCTLRGEADYGRQISAIALKGS